MTRGFTLLELLVVLIIVGLVSALVAPRLTGPMANLNLKTTAKNVCATLRYARNRAASEKVACTTIFDFEDHRLLVETGNIKDTEGDMGDSMPVDEGDRHVDFKVYDFPDGINLEYAVISGEKIDSGRFEVVFLPNGSSTGGKIVLSNDRGRRFDINVDFITGAVDLAVMEGTS